MPDTTSTMTTQERDELVQALCDILATLDPSERRPGAPTPRLDRAVTRWSRDVASPVDALGVIALVRAQAPDARARRRAEILHRAERVAVAAVSERQVREALTDSLTGLATRARLDEEVQHLVAASLREGSPLTAVMLDVDGLKQVNDEHGHAAGDAAIAEVGRAIRTHLRQADRAFRYGGDEFALFLPGTTAEGARVLVERIRNSCATPVSAGVATHSGPAGDADLVTWLSRADLELYGRRRERRAEAPVVPVRRHVVGAALLLAGAVGSTAGLLGVPAAWRSFSGNGSPSRQAAVRASTGLVAPVPVVAPQAAGRAPARSPGTSVGAAVRAVPVRVVTVAAPVRTAPVTQVVHVVARRTAVLPSPPPGIPTPGTPTPGPTPSGLVTGLLHSVGGLLGALL